MHGHLNDIQPHSYNETNFSSSVLILHASCTTYTTAACSEKLLTMDRGTVRNMQSFIPKINLRN